MKPWLTQAWELLRDVGMTCFGGWIIYRQVAGTSASFWLTCFGGVLMIPAARANFVPLLLHAIGQLSSISPSSGELPPGSSSPPEVGTGE